MCKQKTEEQVLRQRDAMVVEVAFAIRTDVNFFINMCIIIIYVAFMALFTINANAFSTPLLPEPYQFPQTPKQGNVKCRNCGEGEKPHIDRFCYAVAHINLFEENQAPNNDLLSVYIGEPAPFSPENRYMIHPPGTPGAINDYLMAELGRWKVLFKAKMDEIGSVSFFATNVPGYALKRDGDFLVITNFNTLCEYYFTSIDAGKSWKLVKLASLGRANYFIKCEYDSEGYMKRLIMPGGNSYKFLYKYGQINKILSPNNALTIFYWDESGFIRRIKTVLTKHHPFYKVSMKLRQNIDRETRLPVARDIHVTSTMDGHLESLTNTAGERFTSEYLLDQQKNKKITTGILTNPNGRRDYRTNQTLGGKREAEKGAVEKKGGEDVFLPYQKLRYASSNGSMYIISSKGLKRKRAHSSLAVVETEDQLGNKTRYKYNELWLRTQKINPDGSVLKKEYDDAGRITKEIDECNRIKIYKRNKQGLITEFHYGDNVTKYEYNTDGYPSKTITPDGLIHMFEWDKHGRMVAYTQPDGVKTTYSYWGGLDFISKKTVFDNLGKESSNNSFYYDVKGRLIRIYYQDKTYDAYWYNCCNMIAHRYRNGKVAKYTYDASQKLTKVTINNKIVFQALYDKYGRLLKKKRANGTWELRKYDKDWHTAARKTPDNKIRQYFRNAAGWVTKTKTNKGTEALYEYNYKRKITSIRGTETPWRDYNYDGTGNLVSTAYYGMPTTATSHLARKIQYEYDNLNRKVKTTFPDGSVEQNVYKEGSDQLEYVRKNNIYTFYTYNDKGQVHSISVVTKKELDAALTKTEKRALIDSKVTEIMKYDSLGRLERKLDVNGYILALYVYSGTANTASLMIEPISEQFGALIRLKKGRKKFIKYVKLDKYIT